MNYATRTLSLALVLFAVYVAGAIALQLWLHRESLRMRDEVVAMKRAQLHRALTLLDTPGRAPAEADLAALGGALGGVLTLVPAGAPEPGSDSHLQVVDAALASRPGTLARLAFPPPAIQKLSLHYQRTLVLVVVLGALLMSIPLLLGITRRLPSPSPATRHPWQEASSAMSGLTEMARLSNERGAQLARESDARQRAEEDLQASQTLLTSAQQERIRLGRELHDNTCQTLFAVSLSLESVAKRLAADPAAMQRLAQCITELRRLNQEVRAYLSELEPGEVQRQSFTQALDAMLGSLPDDGGHRVTSQIDGEFAALIPGPQAVQVVSILREAVSNALRHGGASTISLRAERDDCTLALAVIDDGAGFTPGARRRDGHGLVNMEARARELGGTLRVDSTPGKGTRVLLLLPVASAS